MNKEELIDLVSDWTNKEKAQAISVLKTLMAESVVKRTDPFVVSSYVREAVKQGLSGGNIQDYPEDFGSTAKSMFYKEVIQSVVKELKDELKVDQSNEALVQAWISCEKSKNLIDLRRNFKVYCSVLRLETYSKEDVQEYVKMIDDLDREVRSLRDYKRIHDEMFGVLSENDEELNIVLKANKMKDGGFTDKEICRVLDLSRTQLNYARKKVVLKQQ